MKNEEVVRLAFSSALDKLIQDRVIERCDVMFKLLDEGVPPSRISGLENCDTEEIVQFLCKYHHAKMLQERSK